ncbi:hypothetical protein Btru_041414 [Bulinus truncatus]|nr:hypothetical protein Btru_041414 [Bulinus truncatus]
MFLGQNILLVGFCQRPVHGINKVKSRLLHSVVLSLHIVSVVENVHTYLLKGILSITIKKQPEFSLDNKNAENLNREELELCESCLKENMGSDLESTPMEHASGFPPIDIHELAKVLRDPNMPSQKIMNEVADHIVRKVGEKENGSNQADGGSEGMKSVVDCIIEVCLRHEDSENSDDDDDYDEEDEKILHEIPCKFCNKIFNSSMTCKTHILVAHPQQDPSVLNIKYLSEKEVNKKNSASRRKSSKGSSKADRDVKSFQHKLIPEAPAHAESNPLDCRQQSDKESHTLLPRLSESPASAADRRISHDELYPGREAAAKLKDADTIDTCDTSKSISGSVSEPEVFSETKYEHSIQDETQQCVEQGTNNPSSAADSHQASKHKLCDNDGDISTKKSRNELSSEDPST